MALPRGLKKTFRTCFGIPLTEFRVLTFRSKWNQQNTPQASLGDCWFQEILYFKILEEMKEPLQEGRYFHIYNRGNNRENLFFGEINYGFFLKKYATYCYPVLDTYAYCLLKNHFHLLVRVRSPKEMKDILEYDGIDEKIQNRLTKNEWSPKLVSRQLSHLFNGYTQAINKKYGRTGSLFERHFERKLIDENSYFCNLVSYIHRNPQLHGIIDNYKLYSHSSWSIYFSDKHSRLNTKETLEKFGGLKNFEIAHDEGMKIPKEYIFD